MNSIFSAATLLLAVVLAGCSHASVAQVPSAGQATPSNTVTVARPVVPVPPAAASNTSPSPAPAAASGEKPVTYRVKQVVRLDQIKPDAQTVRMWVSLPDDDAQQRVLDLNVVAAPGKWSIVRDRENRARFLKVEVEKPAAEAFDVEVDFVVTRHPISVTVDPARAGVLSETLKKAFAEHLVPNAPHMEVTDKIRKLAADACGQETNVAVQVSKLMDYVAAQADHYSYSKDPSMPKCGVGDAANCLAQKGGCCTDLHSLFIALARARGIPARLQMGYRLQEKNVGKLVDPGYRCWVEYFVPNYGWVAADLVEGDAPGGFGLAFWAHGLTARRVWLNQGREFELDQHLAVGRVNHMSIGYAEIDGAPARLLPAGEKQPQLTRQVQFTEITTP